jgi:hypothetical protein
VVGARRAMNYFAEIVAAGLAAVASLATAAASLAALLAAAVALAGGEWIFWQLGRRVGAAGANPVLPAWIGGIGGWRHPRAEGGETVGAAIGFAVIVAGVVFPAVLAVRAVIGTETPGGAGVIALAPIGWAIGYAIAADRAATPEAAAHRFREAARVVLGAPAWMLAVALHARVTGSLDLGPLGGMPFSWEWRLAIAAALVWAGLFVLPGAVPDDSASGRPWGADPYEESRTVRHLTGAAHYAALALLCAVAGFALFPTLGAAGAAAGASFAVAVAYALRFLGARPRAGAWLRRGRHALVPALLAAGVWLGTGTGA